MLDKIIEAKNGNQSSRTKVLELYVPYIKRLLIGKYGNDNELGEAILVLNDCINKYNVDSNASLITFAYPYIINRINEVVNDLPYLNGNITKVKNKRQAFYAEYGYYPSIEELVEEYNLKENEVKYAYNILDFNFVPITNIDIPDEDHYDSPELVIPNGVLTREEKVWLNNYLKGETDSSLCKKRKHRYGYYRDYFNNVVTKLKDYESRKSETNKEGTKKDKRIYSETEGNLSSQETNKGNSF